ncbi:hypothetical protein ACGVWS_03890, partial [Enterobacteriaceae bacterium LUAb1]
QLEHMFSVPPYILHQARLNYSGFPAARINEVETWINSYYGDFFLDRVQTLNNLNNTDNYKHYCKAISPYRKLPEEHDAYKTQHQLNALIKEMITTKAMYNAMPDIKTLFH